MSSLPNRLKAHRIFLGLTQEAMALVLELNPSTYRHLETDEPPKEVTKVLRRAQRLGVTVDWLAGVEGAPKWGPPVCVFRESVMSHAASLSQPGTMGDRFRRVVQLAHLCEPPVSHLWFLPAALGISEDAMEAITRGNDSPITSLVVSRLAELVGLTPEWFFVGGDPTATSSPGDSVSYGEVVALFKREGIPPDELAAAHEEIIQVIIGKRAQVGN